MVLTVEDGSFVIEALPNAPVGIDYAGDKTYQSASKTVTLKVK